MKTYSMPCRDLNSLEPIAKQACELFLQECKKQELIVGVCETLRTAEYQKSLYDKGRTKPGKIVTQCDGYKSKSEHQSGMAFDFFQNIKGKEWDYSFYQKACPIAKKLGLDSGFYWTSFTDNPHITVGKNWKPKSNKQKVRIDGVVYETDAKIIDDSTYIKLRDFEKAGYIIDYINGLPTIDKKVK